MRSRATLVIASLTIVVAACSGAATPSSAAPTLAGPASAAPPSTVAPSAASVAPSVAATETPAPTAAPTESPSEEPSAAASESPEPSIDFGDLSANLSHLTSYQEEYKQTGGTADLDAKITIVRSPSVQEEADIGGGKNTERFIIIGKDTWVDQGTGKFVKNMEPPAVLQAEFDAFDPGAFIRSFQKAVNFQELTPEGIESKNGVQAVHYHADDTTQLPAGRPTIPPGAVFDLWVSPDGDYLVALEYSGLKENDKSVTGSIELTNINDPSLSVSAPS